MKTFLVAHNPVFLPATLLTGFLDTQPLVLNWMTPFMGAVLIVASPETEPNLMSALIRAKFPDAQFVLVTANANDAQGWAPKAFWELLTSPKSSGKWNAPESPSGLAALLSRIPEPPNSAAEKPKSLYDILLQGKK